MPFGANFRYKIGRALFFNESLAVNPTDLRIGLYTGTPGIDGVDPTLNEVTGDGYTRVTPSIQDGYDGTIYSLGRYSNDTQISWGPLTESWGTISHIAIIDNSLEPYGNIIYYEELDTPIPTSTGTLLVLEVAALLLRVY